MNQKEGIEFANEQGLLKDRGDFYKLYKSICRLKTLNPAEKLLFTTIISYTDRGLTFHMSTATLAEECGFGTATVPRVLTSLKEKGFIKTYKVFYKNTNKIVGRTIAPQLEFLNEEISNDWNRFRYEEY